MKILVTCFEPFGADTVNASREAVVALPDSIAGADIVKAELPTVFGRSVDVLRQAIGEHQPDVVICVGQAGGRFGITPERVALNLMDAQVPDNSGFQPVDIPIEVDGPAAYFSTLPVKAIVAAIKEAGIPASVSNSAGTYVCNQLMYALLHMIHTEIPHVKGGFIHVPYTPAQATHKKNMPSLSSAEVSKGLALAIEVVVKN